METLYNVYIKIFGYGQIQIPCNGNELKKICEEYMKKFAKNKELIIIDVCNIETSEVRRIWRNKNTTLFCNS